MSTSLILVECLLCAPCFEVGCLYRAQFFWSKFFGAIAGFYTPPSTSRYRDPLGRLLGLAVGCILSYMNFENSSNHRLCKSNITLAVCYFQVNFEYSSSMLVVWSMLWCWLLAWSWVFSIKIFWGYSWLLDPPKYLSVQRPPGQVLRASDGLVFFFIWILKTFPTIGLVLAVWP